MEQKTNKSKLMIIIAIVVIIVVAVVGIIAILGNKTNKMTKEQMLEVSTELKESTLRNAVNENKLQAQDVYNGKIITFTQRILKIEENYIVMGNIRR